MKVVPRFLYLAAFLGMVAAAALALNRAVQPSMSADLLRAVIAGGVLGAAGLVHRKAWGVSLILLPVGAYVLFRTVLPPDATVQGTSGLYHFYIDAFATGAEQYAGKYFPLGLDGAPELRLVLATAVYCLAGLGSFSALSLRQPIPAVALSLLLLGFSFTVDTIPRVLVLALVFLIMAACVLVLSRSLERRTWRPRDAVSGVLMGGAGAALAVVLLGAVPSAAATPWQDWRTWNPFNQGSSVFSFNWLQNYPQLLNPATNTVIMRVESSKPTYWRANALDEFTGEAWVSSQSFLQTLERTQEAGDFVFTVPPADTAPSGTAVTERFRIRSVYTNYFFTGGDPLSLTLGQSAIIRMNDMRSLHVVTAMGPSLDYSLEAMIPDVTPESLVGLGRDYPDAVARYLDLPFPRLSQLTGGSSANEGGDALWRATVSSGQWSGLYALNASIIGQATDPYDIALRLEHYLRTYYEYDLEPPRSDYSSPYAAFLFDTRTGYCQHFAGAMALLLRFNGVPARVAVGFTNGEKVAPGVYSVATNNAHAWVEAYFPSMGWMTFDPTPGRNVPYAGASSTSPGFRNPFASGSSPVAPLTDDTIPRSAPGRSGGAADLNQDSDGPSWIASVPWLPWVIGLVVVVAAWPFARRLWQERGLRRGSLTQRFAASLRLLRGSLAAYGVAATSSSTFEDVLAFIEEHLGLACDPLLVSRAGAVLFGGRHARTDDVHHAEEFRHEVEAALKKRHGLLRSILVWYGVPPSKRPGPGRRTRRGAPVPTPAPVLHKAP